MILAVAEFRIKQCYFIVANIVTRIDWSQSKSLYYYIKLLRYKYIIIAMK